MATSRTLDFVSYVAPVGQVVGLISLSSMLNYCYPPFIHWFWTENCNICVVWKIIESQIHLLVEQKFNLYCFTFILISRLQKINQLQYFVGLKMRALTNIIKSKIVSVSNCYDTIIVFACSKIKKTTDRPTPSPFYTGCLFL